MFEIGQIFENAYPPEVSVWCGKNKANIEEIESVTRWVDEEFLVADEAYDEEGNLVSEAQYETRQVEKVFRRFQIVAIPEPTKEELEERLQATMTDAVQSALDNFAKTRGYDGIMSACSYSNSTDAQFKLEADYCIALRDTTWRMGYAILAEVKAGNRPVPSVEELIAELPVGSAKWPDEE